MDCDRILGWILKGIETTHHIADGLLDGVGDMINENSIDYWLEQGYYVLCRKEYYEYELYGERHEEIEHEFVASYTTYEEAKAAKPWFGDYYIASPR